MQGERCLQRFERIPEISPHHSLGNVGSQISTPTLQSHTVLLLCDNFTMASYLQKEGGGHSQDLCLRSWDSILKICLAWRTRLLVLRILSHMNVIAESITLQASIHRLADQPCLFKQIFDLLPTLSVDLFATCCNAQLLQFLSPFPDKSAKGVDALYHAWDLSGMLYVFPPTLLLTAILGRI